MTGNKHGKTPPARGESREDRLKAALKANMAKRKAQMRGRAAKQAHDTQTGAGEPPEDTGKGTR